MENEWTSFLLNSLTFQAYHEIQRDLFFTFLILYFSLCKQSVSYGKIKKEKQ